MAVATCLCCGSEFSEGDCRCPRCGIAVSGANRAAIPLTPELVDWANREFRDEDTLLGIEEIQRTGGLQLQDFLRELEAASFPSSDAWIA